VRELGKFLQFRSAVIFGGVGYEPQVQAIRRGLDVLIATPGRLLDHAGQRTVDLSGVEILVLDEADRMLDMGFIHDIKRVIALLPPKRQNLLFSATFPAEVQEIINKMMNNPERIEAARRTVDAESVSQVVHHVDKERKRELLSHLITKGSWKQVLVFTRTKHGANKLSEQLGKAGITASAIHGNKSQSARTKALADFKQGRVRVLVATDIAARGLDIDRLPHVVNFELPHVPEDYVHRIGRTGRAGLSGEAVSLVSGDERLLIAGIQRLLKRDIPIVEIDGFKPSAGFRTAEPVSRGGRSGGRSFTGATARPGQGSGRRPAPAADRNRSDHRDGGKREFRSSDRRSSTDSRPAGSWRSGDAKPRWKKSGSRSTAVTGYE
jgi:ATP-dependent RNA helicase RhlE